MKTVHLISAAILAASGLFIISCNDDYLKTEDKKSYIMTDTLDLYPQITDQDITLNISEAHNSPYTVMIYPKWLDLSPMHGKFTDGKLVFTLSTTKEADYNSGIFLGNIVIDIADFGYLQFVTRYNGLNAVK
jgi:hypothetical protein